MPVDGRFIDRAGVQDFTDDDGVALFADGSTPTVYLGIGLPSAAGVCIVADRVLDLGLSVLVAEPDNMCLCSSEPTTYAEVASSLLCHKEFGVGGVFGAIGTGSPGRRVASTLVTDGIVDNSGTVTHWAAIDNANSRLLARGPVVTPKPVTSGGQFFLSSFTLTMPGQ